MADGDDEKDEGLETTLISPSERPEALDGAREFEEVFRDIEALLKNGDVIASLTLRGINASLALLAVDGLRAYVRGQKLAAAEDFATVAEEIKARLAK